MPTAVRRPGPLSERSQLTADLRANPNAALPEGWIPTTAPVRGRTQTGVQDFGTQVVAGREPGFIDWLYRNAPGMLAAAASYGLATGPALGGANLATQLGANAGLQAGMTAAGGGGIRDIATAGAMGAIPGGTVPSTTSGWLQALPAIAGAIGQVAGGAAGSRSDQRQQEGATTNAFNNAEIARYQTEQAAQNQAAQLDLQRKMFSEDARGGRAKQAALADLISNLQDISINVPGIQTASVSGGLRPSALGGTGRQGMAELGKQALAALLEGDTFTGGQILQGPQMTPMPQQSGLERGLNYTGLIGSGIGSVAAILKALEEEQGTYSALPGATGIRPQGLG